MPARDIHLKDNEALLQQYKVGYLPDGFVLRVNYYLRHVKYVLWYGNSIVFRAQYQLDNDELVDVKTRASFRGRGIARAVLAIILRVDGPAIIRAGPSPDSPLGVHQLIRFYSSFPGYHAIPGTNKVVKLMQDTIVEEADLGVEEAAELGYGRRDKTMLEISVLERNSKELNRIMSILHEQNENEVARLLAAQATDTLSLETATKIYGAAFFDSRPWGRVHRVAFARGMNALYQRHTGMTYGVWDSIIEQDSESAS